jgi:hypothetical protein
MANPNYRKVEAAARIKRDYLNAPTWFQQKHQQSPLSCIASSRRKHGCSSGYRHGKRQNLHRLARKLADQIVQSLDSDLKRPQPSAKLVVGPWGLRKFVRGITTNSWNHNRDSLFLLDLKR